MKTELTDISPLTSKPGHVKSLIAVVIFAVIGGISIVVTAILTIGLVETVICSLAIGVFAWSAAMSRKRKYDLAEFQANCDHYYVGGSCIKCDYTPMRKEESND